MTNPIYSFTSPESGLRYYIIWYTMRKVPSIIPMDIVTLMMYQGIKDTHFLRSFHQVFPQLIQNGSSLAKSSFQDLSAGVKQHLAEMLPVIDQPPLHHRAVKLYAEIEALFTEERDFNNFHSRLEKVLGKHPKTLPRPLHYYSSWEYTYDAVNGYSSKRGIKVLLEEFAKKSKLELLGPKVDISDWLSKGYFSKHTALMADLFFSLGNSNLIEIGAIPHILRSDPRISRLFELYGMEHLLPQNTFCKDDDSSDWKWKYYPIEGKFRLQYFNYCLHSSYGIADSLENELSDLGKPLHELNNQELENLSVIHSKWDMLANYPTDTGYSQYPFYYLRADETNDLVIIGKYHQNALDVFSKKSGQCLKDKGFYSLKIVDSELLDGVYNDELCIDHIIYRYSKYHDKLFYIRSYRAQYDLDVYADKTTYYFSNGWFTFKSNKPVSPMCFTGGGRFCNGLAPVCFDGRWGYVNQDYSFQIEPVFAYASAFCDGFAKVFILKKEFQDRRGVWMSMPTWIPLVDSTHSTSTKASFEKKFPDFPGIQSLPMKVLCERSWSDNLIDENYFGNKFGWGLGSKYGRYVVIDPTGKIVFENASGVDFNLSENGMLRFPEMEDLWFDIEKATFFSSAGEIDIKNLDLKLLPYETDNYSLSGGDLKGEFALTKSEIIEKVKEAQTETNFFQSPAIRIIPWINMLDEDLMYDLLSEKYIDYYDLPLPYQFNKKFVSQAMKIDFANYHKIPHIYLKIYQKKYDSFRKEEFTQREREDLPF